MLTEMHARGVTDALEQFGMKTADIAKIVRMLKTPIPGTPKLLMNVRSPAVLHAEESLLRNRLRDTVNGGLYKGLKKLRVDRAYQHIEPFIGNTTAPAAERASFGDRQIHNIAHRPFHFLIGNAPIPYAATAHNALAVAHQKLMGVPPPRAYGAPAPIPAHMPATPPAPAPRPPVRTHAPSLEPRMLL